MRRSDSFEQATEQNFFEPAGRGLLQRGQGFPSDFDRLGI
jgi:hypothetical protein